MSGQWWWPTSEEYTRSLDLCGRLEVPELATEPFADVQIVRPDFWWNSRHNFDPDDLHESCRVYRLSIGNIAVVFPSRLAWLPRDALVTDWVQQHYGVDLVHDREYGQLEHRCPVAFWNSYAQWYDRATANALEASIRACRLCNNVRPHTGVNVFHTGRVKQPCDECRTAIRQRVNHLKEKDAIKRSKALLRAVRTVSRGETPDETTLDLAKSPKQREREAADAMKRTRTTPARWEEFSPIANMHIE